jgi:hypothetical protein
LLIPALAQRVLTFDLEVQRCHVVEHDRQARGPGGVPVTGLRDHGPVIPPGHALEAAHERHAMRGRDPDLGQDADGVQLAGRLDHPGQDQRPERPIAETIQAQVVVDAGQDLPQDQRGRALDHRWRPRSVRAGVAQIQIQSQLPGMAAFPGDLQQHGELVVGVGRADVLDAQHAPAPLVHDLDRGRTRGGLHPPHEHAHPARLPTPPAALVTTPGPIRR